MKPPVQIRAAEIADQQGILQCLAAAFEPYRAQYSAGAYTDTTLDLSTLQERFRSMHILVATEADRVIGTISAAVHRGEGHLRGMSVLPQWSGKGLAKRLLDEIEAWLRAQGCMRVSLDTTEPLKPAMKFYEKNGYKRSGVLTDFYGMALIEYEKKL